MVDKLQSGAVFESTYLPLAHIRKLNNHLCITIVPKYMQSVCNNAIYSINHHQELNTLHFQLVKHVKNILQCPISKKEPIIYNHRLNPYLHTVCQYQNSTSFKLIGQGQNPLKFKVKVCNCNDKAAGLVFYKLMREDINKRGRRSNKSVLIGAIFKFLMKYIQ